MCIPNLQSGFGGHMLFSSNEGLKYQEKIFLFVKNIYNFFKFLV